MIEREQIGIFRKFFFDIKLISCDDWLWLTSINFRSKFSLTEQTYMIDLGQTADLHLGISRMIAPLTANFQSIFSQFQVISLALCISSKYLSKKYKCVKWVFGYTLRNGIRPEWCLDIWWQFCWIDLWIIQNVDLFFKTKIKAFLVQSYWTYKKIPFEKQSIRYKVLLNFFLLNLSCQNINAYLCVHRTVAQISNISIETIHKMLEC